ncbi:Flp pilus assembly protein protease CpaA [Streptomyces clavifer]|uniref:Flp pilus assembly protein protease CpaA n=1 Tax=Streptomyces clavifer TaxID=68188 RepID=A0ABS4VIR1_9ACTN|nr:Flp pilus assembly protein protease CpaA [Streptomyces clavifer]
MTGLGVLWTIGIILLVIGLALWLLGSMGRAVGGRKHYW